MAQIFLQQHVPDLFSFPGSCHSTVLVDCNFCQALVDEFQTPQALRIRCGKFVSLGSWVFSVMQRHAVSYDA